MFVGIIAWIETRLPFPRHDYCRQCQSGTNISVAAAMSMHVRVSIGQRWRRGSSRHVGGGGEGERHPHAGLVGRVCRWCSPHPCSLSSLLISCFVSGGSAARAHGHWSCVRHPRSHPPREPPLQVLSPSFAFSLLCPLSPSQ